MPKYRFKRFPLTREEQLAVEAACKTTKEKMIIWTLLDTGIRISELCGITRDCLDADESTILIKNGKRNSHDTQKKGTNFASDYRERVVFYSTRCKSILEPYFKTHEKWPIQQRACQRIVQIIGERAGLKRRLHPHLLRHTFASRYVQADGDIYRLSKILGHASVTTTQIYAHLAPMHDEVLSKI